MGDAVSTKVSRRTAEDRRRLFVAAYVSNGRNATQAAIAAGYAKGSAKQEGSRLLSRDDVSEAIEKATRRVEEKAGLTAERVLRELAALCFLDPAQLYGPEGALLPIDKMPEDARRALAGLDVEELFEGRGEEREQVGVLRKVKFWDKNTALEKAMKHLGLLKETVQHQGTVYVIDPYAAPAAGAPDARTVPPAPAADRKGSR